MTSSCKKLVIFGASGNTGLATIQAALISGYEVTAFVRDKLKLGATQPHYVIEGNVLNKIDVSKAIAGQDAVIVTLGTRNDLAPTTMMSDGMKNIIEAMKLNNVKLVSCCISSFLFWPRERVPKPYIPVTEDHERMLEVLKTSDLDWVAVLPPQITDGPARQNYIIKNEEPVGREISKFDLGEILVKCLMAEEHRKHFVGIGYPQ